MKLPAARLGSNTVTYEPSPCSPHYLMHTINLHLPIILNFSSSTQTLGRCEEALIGHKLGRRVEFEPKSGFVREVDTTIVGEDFVEE